MHTEPSSIVLLSVSTLTVDGRPGACDVCGQTDWLRLVGAYGHGLIWCNRWHVSTRPEITENTIREHMAEADPPPVVKQLPDGPAGTWPLSLLIEHPGLDELVRNIELYTAWAEIRRHQRIVERALEAGPGASGRDATTAICMQSSAA